MAFDAINNKKILTNTLALYFRQIITMVVALFTSRVVLQTLGVTDFGINNVVGGVVAMLWFISGTLVDITQRFISVELGKDGDFNTLRKIFSTSMALHIVAAVVVLLIAETVGLWFLNNKLVIPPERMLAANWVYQFAVFSFVLSLLNAPLTALIISNEDMHVFGFMGIFDVVARLITVYLLVIVNGDKLIFFALFGFIVSCLVLFFYTVYCRKKYQYARFRFVYDKALIKELSGFGGYVFVGNIFIILVNQGVNIMMNIFFGPAVNAARGLANSLNSALLSFGNNFIKTLTPQITMSYSANNLDVTWSLTERGIRMYYFLLFIFSLPIFLETEFILKLWLGDVPEYTAIFVKIMIFYGLLMTFPTIYWFIVHASGKLKLSYSLDCFFNIIVIILAYIACRMGYPPHYVLGVNSVILLVLHLPTFLFLSKKLYGFPIRFFAKKALLPILLVTLISVLPFYFSNKFLEKTAIISFLTILTSILWVGVVVIFVGLTKNERVKIFGFLKQKLYLRFFPNNREVAQ